MHLSDAKTNPALNATALLNLFEKELSYLLWAEKMQSQLLIQLQNKASVKQLRDVLISHENTIKRQFQIIETVFTIIQKPVAQRKCEAFQGLIKKAEVVLVNSQPGPSTDLQIISILQKIKHHQIVSYSLLCVFAQTLMFDNANLLLYENLEQATYFDRLLGVIAEFMIDFASADL